MQLQLSTARHSASRTLRLLERIQKTVDAPPGQAFTFLSLSFSLLPCASPQRECIKVTDKAVNEGRPNRTALPSGALH